MKRLLYMGLFSLSIMASEREKKSERKEHYQNKKICEGVGIDPKKFKEIVKKFDNGDSAYRVHTKWSIRDMALCIKGDTRGCNNAQIKLIICKNHYNRTADLKSDSSSIETIDKFFDIILYQNTKDCLEGKIYDDKCRSIKQSLRGCSADISPNNKYIYNKEMFEKIEKMVTKIKEYKKTVPVDRD